MSSDTSGDRKNVSKYFLELHWFTGSLYSTNRFKRCWEAPAEGMEEMLQIKTTWHRTAQAAEGPTRKVAVHVASCVCSVRCVSSNGKRSVERTKIYLWNLVVSYFLHRLEQHCQALEESLKLYDACATHLKKRFGGRRTKTKTLPLVNWKIAWGY